MSVSSFQDFWNEHYPETIPMGYRLKMVYPERWFRIHSLPESKRYADDEDEWKILLYRQNTLITDLLGDNQDIYIVTGRYCFLDKNYSKVEKDYFELDCFEKWDFEEWEAINLAERYPKDYDEVDRILFIPVSMVVTWKPHAFDGLLKKIADDEVRALFVGMTKRIIVSPYDGGVDCIVENSTQVEYYRNKYQHWLSRLESGL